MAIAHLKNYIAQDDVTAFHDFGTEMMGLFQEAGIPLAVAQYPDGTIVLQTSADVHIQSETLIAIAEHLLLEARGTDDGDDTELDIAELINGKGYARSEWWRHQLYRILEKSMNGIPNKGVLISEGTEGIAIAMGSILSCCPVPDFVPDFMNPNIMVSVTMTVNSSPCGESVDWMVYRTGMGEDLLHPDIYRDSILIDSFITNVNGEDGIDTGLEAEVLPHLRSDIEAFLDSLTMTDHDFPDDEDIDDDNEEEDDDMDMED